ncbi:MAG: site-specific integrase [Stagnimonas sp.]|nr:site-specific integrase [Stagnimonas sp.]
MAQRWIKLVEVELEKGAFKSTNIAERMTLGEALQRFADEVLPSMRSRAPDISKIKMITPHLGSYPLISLDNAALAIYRDKRLGMKARNFRKFKDGRTEMVELKRKVATMTVRHELAPIRRMIEHGRREWGIHLPAGNPVHLLKLPPMGRPRDRRLSADEEEKLLALLDPAPDLTGQRSPYMRALMIFSLETTSRRGESLRLRWEDVDLSARTALLRDTKNGEDRRIGLSTKAVQALNTIPMTRDGRVFPLTDNAMRMAWRRATQRLGIDGLHFHDLRHEGTSRLAVKFNGDVMAMSAMTGHKSLQMLKRYTHLRAEDLATRLG